MAAPSVAVIGGGAIGLSTALHLAELGADDVVVLERSHVAAESSGLSVGIIETQYVEPLDIELRVRSMELFRRLERDRGLHVVRNGYLRLVHSADRLPAFEASMELQRELGVADACVLDAAGVQELVPDLRCDDVAGGLWGPSDGYIDGHLYCSLLADLARAAGVRVRTGTAFSPDSLDCDVVVNAAGAWAGEVGALLGAPIPLLPQRHQAVVAHLAEPLPYVMPSVMDYMPHSGGFGLYFRHEQESQLVAGLHTEEPIHDVADPDAYNHSADLEFLAAVAELLAARLPGLPGVRLGHGWAGLYPVSPDGAPVVGPCDSSGRVFAAAGAGGSGLQISPLLGRLAAEWIVHGEPRSLPAAVALAPTRFVGVV